MSILVHKYPIGDSIGIVLIQNNILLSIKNLNKLMFIIKYKFENKIFYNIIFIKIIL